MRPSLTFAKALGFDHGTVRRYRKRGMPTGDLEAARAWIKANGIVKRRPRNYPEKVCASCLYRTGLGVKRMSKLVPFSPSVLSRWVKRAGLSEPDVRNRLHVLQRKRKAGLPVPLA